MHKDMYYNEVMERWFAANGTGLAASSYEKYYRLYANHIRPFFRDVKVSELSEDLLDAYRAELEQRRSSRGGELSAGTVRCIAMLANRGICAAREGHMLKEEMRLQANKPGGKEIVQVFTEAEQRRLEQYLRSAMDASRMGVYLCLYTGLRIGELCSLRWEDVDLETGSICVRKTVQRLRVPGEGGATSLVEGQPKSRTSARVIPYPDFLRAFLQREGGARQYILSGSEIRPMDPRTLQYRYKRYLKEAGIPYRKFHTLRHTFATRCLMAGVDVKTLSELLGHADIRTTLGIYCHASLQYKREQVNRLQPFAQEAALLK